MSKPVAVIPRVGLLGLGALCLAFAAGAEPMPGRETFADALRAAGWNVEVLADGSLQLTAAPQSLPVADAVEPQTPALPKSGPDGWSVLRTYGWRVETGPDGTTFLFPPPAVSSVESEKAPEPARSEAQAEVARDLDALLAERGWRAEREADGSVLLFPLLRAAGAPAALEPSAGHVPAAVREEKVPLPIDSWEKAQAVALSWLETVGDPALRPGKIRRILRVYLVSIVGDEPPHPLLHQIAVGVDDGRVVVLN